MKRFVFALGLVGILSGCTHQAVVSTVSPTNIYSGHDSKIDAQSTYTIDGTSLSKLRKEDAIKGMMCSAHRFPVDGTDAFITSIPAMLDSVFEIPTEQANDPRKNSVHFVFRVERFDPRIKYSPKFFSSEAESTVELSVSAVGSVNGKRVFGTTVDSQRTKSSEGGSFCSGGEEGLAEATSAVIKDVLEKVGERIANSMSLRSSLLPPQKTKSNTK